MLKYLFIFVLLCVPFAVQADNITNNVVNGCNTNFLDLIGGIANFVPDFSINQYTCDVGNYLPANSESCAICPDSFTCIGGTFDFDETKSQGIVYNSVINQNIANACSENMTVFEAIFYPTQYTCSAGYYLPANVDECRKCLNDHYCPGGNLTFNETTPQGITACPSEHPFAPAGMWAATQCGRILHIGNEIIYLHQSPANPTEHRLYVRVNDTVYSVNLTQKQDDPDDIKMSAGANRSLHIMFNDIEYLAHDDSVE